MGKELTASRPARQSNIELLRILAMLMIVSYHFVAHSGFDFATDSVSFNRLWVQLFEMNGKIGVDIFVLISGYFLVTAKSIKINKIANLWLQIFTYSIGIFAVAVILSPENFGIKALVKNLMPITFTKWWFASTYFMLYLLTPFINRLLNSFDKKEYQKFLILLFVFWCIFPTFLNAFWESNSLLWFVFLYALSGYIRLHTDVTSIKSGRCILIAIGTIVLTFSSVVFLDFVGLKFSFVAPHSTFFYGLQKLPMLIISLMLFLGFASANIGSVPFINTISATCFGIYLIHDNNYVREYVWCTFFKNANHQNSKFLILYTLIETVIVFVACALIELIRIHIIERLYSKPISRLSDWLDKRLDKLFSRKFFEKH